MIFDALNIKENRVKANETHFPVAKLFLTAVMLNTQPTWRSICPKQ